MHYDINYSSLSEIKKHNKAIQDIKQYLGEELFEKVTRSFKESEPPGIDLFAIILAISVGVQGYPVKAWYNYIWGL